MARLDSPSSQNPEGLITNTPFPLSPENHRKETEKLLTRPDEYKKEGASLETMQLEDVEVNLFLDVEGERDEHMILVVTHDAFDTIKYRVPRTMFDDENFLAGLSTDQPTEMNRIGSKSFSLDDWTLVSTTTPHCPFEGTVKLRCERRDGTLLPPPILEAFRVPDEEL